MRYWSVMSTSSSWARLVLIAVSFVFPAVGSIAAPAQQSKPVKAVEAATTTQSHKAQAVKRHAQGHSHRLASRHRGSGWLIPPPPAYMPSMLPEMYARGASVGPQSASAEDEEVKPENPYKKYIHNANGAAPEAVQSRKGVTIWTRRS